MGLSSLPSPAMRPVSLVPLRQRPMSWRPRRPTDRADVNDVAATEADAGESLDAKNAASIIGDIHVPGTRSRPVMSPTNPSDACPPRLIRPLRGLRPGAPVSELRLMRGPFACRSVSRCSLICRSQRRGRGSRFSRWTLWRPQRCFRGLGLVGAAVPKGLGLVGTAVGIRVAAGLAGWLAGLVATEGIPNPAGDFAFDASVTSAVACAKIGVSFAAGGADAMAEELDAAAAEVDELGLAVPPGAATAAATGATADSEGVITPAAEEADPDRVTPGADAGVAAGPDVAAPPADAGVRSPAAEAARAARASGVVAAAAGEGAETGAGVTPAAEAGVFDVPVEAAGSAEAVPCAGVAPLAPDSGPGARSQVPRSIAIDPTPVSLLIRVRTTGFRQLPRAFQ